MRRENASIIEGLRERGTLIVNGDDAELTALVDRYGVRRITFGFNPRNDLVATNVRSEADGVRFRLNGKHEYSVPLIGRHNAV